MQPNINYQTRPLRVVQDWRDPSPLFEVQEATAYPVEALPSIIGEAVREQQEFGQQPVELVACSALSAVSLAAQGLANIARDDDLIGPISLSFLTIAASGERKSSADKRMSRAVREWEARRELEIAPDVASSRAAFAIWEAERDGLKARIRSAAGDDDSSERDRLSQALITLESEPPERVIPPSLFFEDATQEGIAKHLAAGWPSASLWSDEGGIVVGGHGMKQENATRFFSFLNRLWDGNPFLVRRSTAEPIKLSGRRFTCHLMMQPSVLTDLLGTNGGAARGTGFLARYLIAWPQSTMGTRFYKPRPLNSSALALFDRRIETLLDMPLPTEGAMMELNPPVLRMTPEAQAEWVDFHDEIERQISRDGDFADVADFASKAAESAARLAGAFHVFEHGPVGEVSADTFQRAGFIAAWHLTEARRVMSSVKKPEVISDAEALLQWLRGRGGEVPHSETSSGSRRFRGRRKERDAALAVLEESGSVRVHTPNGIKTVSVNPKLMEMPA